MNQPGLMFPAPTVSLWRLALRDHLLPGSAMFAVGMGMMTAQLLAGRLLAGQLGQSLYTWTATIAIFLLGMAAGNLAGGRLADRIRSGCEIRNILLACAVLTISMPLLNAAMGYWSWSPAWPWPVRILLHAAAVFLPAACAYGMVSPLILRDAMLRSAGRGRAFGRLHAWGTIGNLIGTFLTGFVLFAYVPVRGIVGIAAAWFLMPAAGYLLCGAVPPPQLTRRDDLPPAGKRPWRLAVSWRPYALAAVAGAAIMVVELAAGRLLAQQLGQSLYSWTIAIGVVFAGMSCGAWAGGRCADRYGAQRLLPWLLTAASITVLAVPGLHYYAAERPWLWELVLPRRLLGHGLLVFLAPSVLLGMGIPAMAATAAADPERTGRSVGGIYAGMSLGSIVGTLLAGFVMFGWLGTRQTLAVTAAILALAATLAGGRWPRYWAVPCLTLVVCALAGLPGARALAIHLRLWERPSPLVIYQTESAYSLIAVKEDADDPRLRRLYLDRLQHSLLNLDDPLDLCYHYQRIFAAALATVRPAEQPVNALVLGGGGYVFPRHLELTRPGSDLEVAEIDPAVTQAALAAFGLPPDTTIRSHHLDAGLFVHEQARRQRRGETTKTYDAIFTDSINHLAVPFHLLTVEFLREIRTLLAPDGVYCLILLDSLANGQMLGAAVRTCREVFPELTVFTTVDNPDARDTLVLVAAMTPREWDLIPALIRIKEPNYLGRMLSADELAAAEQRAGGLLLRADFAPVDRLIHDLLREEPEDRADIYLRMAAWHRQHGNFARAIALCHQALATRPGWAAAYNVIGLNHASLGEHALATLAFNEAVRRQPESVGILFNLGVSLEKTGDLEAASDAFNQATRLAPDHPRARFHLASLLGRMGDHANALREWQAYVKLKPHDGEGRYRLAVALWRCRRPGDAQRELRQAEELGVVPDPKFTAALMGGEAPAP